MLMISRGGTDCKRAKWKGRFCEIIEGSKQWSGYGAEMSSGWEVKVSSEDQKCSNNSCSSMDMGAHLCRGNVCLFVGDL